MSEESLAGVSNETRQSINSSIIDAEVILGEPSSRVLQNRGFLD